MNYIVDASIAIKWFLPEIHSEYALRLQGIPDLYAPDFMLLECSNILIKKVRRDELEKSVADDIQQVLLQVPITFTPWQDLLVESAEVAHGTYRSLYDCLYLVLAQRLGGKMVTADKKFYEALVSDEIWGRHLLWIEGLLPA